MNSKMARHELTLRQSNISPLRQGVILFLKKEFFEDEYYTWRYEHVNHLTNKLFTLV